MNKCGCVSVRVRAKGREHEKDKKYRACRMLKLSSQFINKANVISLQFHVHTV